MPDKFPCGELQAMVAHWSRSPKLLCTGPD